MEQEEEKSEIIQRKIRKSSSASSLLANDLISEIFVKLPAKSIMRFRSVSKLWSSITTNSYLTNSFETRPNLLFFFRKEDTYFAFTVSQHNNKNPNEPYSHSFSQPIDSYNITFPKYCSFTIKTESVHGLICFQKIANPVPVVWNPTTRKFLPLPFRKPDQTWRRIAIFLGYDPVEGKHKVVCMPQCQESDVCRIFTLGLDQESWRTVKTNHKHRPPNGYRTAWYVTCRCINGVLYYRAKMGSDQVIMSFDVRSEEFKVIKVPWDVSDWPVMMASYLGRLGCLGFTRKDKSPLLWVLEDAEKHEWSSRKFLPLYHYDRGSEKLCKLIGITNDGELMYVPKRLFYSFRVVYIDPVRQRYRRVEYKGIADIDFRQRNGLENEPLCALQYFPNHIDTLMSL